MNAYISVVSLGFWLGALLAIDIIELLFVSPLVPFPDPTGLRLVRGFSSGLAGRKSYLEWF